MAKRTDRRTTARGAAATLGMATGRVERAAVAFAALVASAAVGLAAACAGGPAGPGGAATPGGPGESAPPTTERPTSELETPSGHALVGTTWKWVASGMGDSTVVTPPAPSADPEEPRYTVRFGDDGTVAVRADCNTGSGRYKTDGQSLLTMGPVAITLVMCDEPSEGARFLQQLHRVDSYVIQADRLQLAVGTGGEGESASPAEATGEADGGTATPSGEGRGVMILEPAGRLGE